jgi:hypothetical protein
MIWVMGTEMRPDALKFGTKRQDIHYQNWTIKKGQDEIGMHDVVLFIS